MATVQQRIIFGLKIRQFRLEKGWNFEELSKHTGISVSYLNEIEKGKKYPLIANQDKLANALGIHRDVLSSPVLTKQYGPLGELLQSNFLNELPLELFGIELQQVVEIIAKAPDRVNAFISALLEIARNYSLRDEHFFFAALRAYQELNMNYFEDLEAEADQFIAQFKIKTDGAVGYSELAQILTKQYGYTITGDGLDQYPELAEMRSVFVPRRSTLLLNSHLTHQQKTFQLAKEIGFNALGLKERPFASSMVRVNNFEETLNNYKAGYFAVALLVNRAAFTTRLDHILKNTAWDGSALIEMLTYFDVSPAVLFQRFNVLSKEFNLHKVFFFRTIHQVDRNHFHIDKELHLNRKHQPHASGLDEHYCRRWLSLTLLNELATDKEEDATKIISGVQRAKFADTGEEYLCIALAQKSPTNSNVGVMLGILMDADARKTIRFIHDTAIPCVTVNVTCERCSIMDCQQRAAPPTTILKKEERKKTLDVLRKILT